MSTPEPFAVLGKAGSQPSKTLDTFAAPLGRAAGDASPVQWVEFAGEELTAFCPVTHQPDFYEFVIGYAPGRLCVESKSMKLYLQSYRDEGMFAEALADKIAKDIMAAIQAQRVLVILKQKVRGGLTLTVTAEEGEHA